MSSPSRGASSTAYRAQGGLPMPLLRVLPSLQPHHLQGNTLSTTTHVRYNHTQVQSHAVQPHAVQSHAGDTPVRLSAATAPPPRLSACVQAGSKHSDALMRCLVSRRRSWQLTGAGPQTGLCRMWPWRPVPAAHQTRPACSSSSMGSMGSMGAQQAEGSGQPSRRPVGQMIDVWGVK